MTQHPSPYALDRVALGEQPDPALAQHLAGCDRCARALSRAQVPLPPPPWLAGLAARRPGRERFRFRRAWLLLPAFAAAAAGVALWPGWPEGEGELALRAKGRPDVAVYVKRGAAVAAWNGRSAVRPDDRIRVGVRGGGYAFVSVASLAPSGPQILYSGPLAEGGETLLPLSFRVDDAAGDELIGVVLSVRPVEPSAHLTADGAGAGPGAWSLRLRIPKENHP